MSTWPSKSVRSRIDVRRAALASLAALSAAWVVGCGSEVPAGDISASTGALTAPASFLVLFSGGAIPANADKLVAGAGGVAARYTSLAPSSPVRPARFCSASSSATSGIDAVGAVNAVHSVWCRDRRWDHSGTARPTTRLPAPGDPLSFRQWDMDQIHAPQAHAISTGKKSVLVGFLDSGIDVTHPDLVGQVNAAASASCLGGVANTSARGLGQRHHRARHVRRRHRRGPQERHRHRRRRARRPAGMRQGRRRRRQRSELRAGPPRRLRLRHRLGDRAQLRRAEREPHHRSVHRADRRHLLQRSARPRRHRADRAHARC